MKLWLQIAPEAQSAPVVDALVHTAEDAGYDAVLASESHGWDTFTPLGWWGSATKRLQLASLAQIGARTPASTAMQALTLDHLSGGRVVVVLTRDDQLSEGWFGSPVDDPLGRVREYVEIVRQVLERDHAVSNPGPHYPLPYAGKDSVGLGTPRKSIVHPLRGDLPIWLTASQPEEVELAAEIADGVLIRDYRLESSDAWTQALSDGAARRVQKSPTVGFEVAAFCDLDVTGFPARGSAGAASGPTMSGSPEQVAEQIRAWARAGITCLVVRPSDAAAARRVADAVFAC